MIFSYTPGLGDCAVKDEIVSMFVIAARRTTPPTNKDGSASNVPRWFAGQFVTELKRLLKDLLCRSRIGKPVYEFLINVDNWDMPLIPSREAERAMTNTDWQILKSMSGQAAKIFEREASVGGASSALEEARMIVGLAGRIAERADGVAQDLRNLESAIAEGM